MVGQGGSGTAAAMGAGDNLGPHCRACYQLLRYMCRSGESSDLCVAFVEYATTGSSRALEKAHEVASPQLMQQAKEHVINLGLAFRSSGVRSDG